MTKSLFLCACLPYLFHDLVKRNRKGKKVLSLFAKKETVIIKIARLFEASVSRDIADLYDFSRRVGVVPGGAAARVPGFCCCILGAKGAIDDLTWQFPGSIQTAKSEGKQFFLRTIYGMAPCILGLLTWHPALV